ncbi:MAG: GEVED domain-containing protein, partial [Bacteroidota bacterium]
AIGDFVYGSGQNDGYAFFPASCFALTPDSSYAIRLIPGYASFNFRESWRIWLDLNQDGDFADDGELIFDPQIGSDSILAGTITVPTDALDGPTRMRVAMQFAGFSGLNVPESCESPDFGEFEDYCVSIESAAETCPIPCGLSLRLAENDTSIQASWAGDPTADYLLYYRSSDQEDWQEVLVSDTSYLLTGLLPCTTYSLALQSLCGGDSSLLGPVDTIATKACTTPIEDELASTIQVYPNPFSGRVAIVSEWPIQRIVLYDLQGRQLMLDQPQSLESSLDGSRLSPGLYVLVVETLRGTLRRRIVKQ